MNFTVYGGIGTHLLPEGGTMRPLVFAIVLLVIVSLVPAAFAESRAGLVPIFRRHERAGGDCGLA